MQNAQRKPVKKTSPQMSRAKKEPDLTTYSGRFAAHLRAMREKKGWSVDELRQKLDFAGYQVANSALYNWEGGHRTPGVEVLPFLAAVYGIPVRSVIPAE